MAKKSKLELYPSYKLEYQANHSILFTAIGAHIKFLEAEKDFQGGNFEDLYTDFYVRFRIQDALVSITDDLIRYGEYNKIEKQNFTIGLSSVDKNGFEKFSYTKDENGDYSMFSIEEPVRAAYFTKWILQLKPSIADKKIDLNKKGLPNEKLEFCNEYLALISMSHIFKVKNKKGDQILGYNSLLGKELIETLRYSLRYRLIHQDSYSELYRHAFHRAIKSHA